MSAAAPTASAYAAPAAMAVAPAAAATGVRYGGFWRRFWAAVIDCILLMIVMWPVRMMMGLSGLSLLDHGDFSAGDLMALIMAGMAVNMLGMLVALVYFAAFESSAKQATLGKMVLGLKVTDMNGGRITLLRAMGRYLASILSTLILCIGYLMIAFTEKKQALHDMITNTLVVRQGS